MPRKFLLKTMAFRFLMAFGVVAVSTPLLQAPAAEARKKKKSSRKKARRHARRQAAAKKKAAAAKKKAAIELHAKYEGKIERLKQIADATKDPALIEVVKRLEEKEAKRAKLAQGK